MNQTHSPTVLIAMSFSISAFAAEQFHDQPNIAKAYKKLTAAQAQSERGKLGGDAKKQMAEASVNLTTAKTCLEQASKNRGSYRTAAIRAIDQAKTEIEAAMTDPTHTEKAAVFVREALEQTAKAGGTGHP